MKNDKGQAVEKDDEIVTLTQKGTQKTSTLTGRPTSMLLLREMRRK